MYCNIMRIRCLLYLLLFSFLSLAVQYYLTTFRLWSRKGSHNKPTDRPAKSLDIKNENSQCCPIGSYI